MAVNTPRDVAVRIALYFTFSITFLVVVYDLVQGQWPNIFFLVGLVVISFFSAYFIAAWAVEKFIYQKVKIIYKTIHQFKKTKDGRRQVNIKEDVMTKVNNEVLVWAEDKIQEIQDFTEAYSFRRDFIGNLGHELTTPVFVFLNW